MKSWLMSWLHCLIIQLSFSEKLLSRFTNYRYNLVKCRLVAEFGLRFNMLVFSMELDKIRCSSYRKAPIHFFELPCQILADKRRYWSRQGWNLPRRNTNFNQRRVSCFGDWTSYWLVPWSLKIQIFIINFQVASAHTTTSLHSKSLYQF
jgi:hypothetical protein